MKGGRIQADLVVNIILLIRRTLSSRFFGMGYLFRGYVGERVSSLKNPGWRGGGAPAGRTAWRSPWAMLIGGTTF